MAPAKKLLKITATNRLVLFKTYRPFPAEEPDMTQIKEAARSLLPEAANSRDNLRKR
jgi:hypothetical protein